MERGTVRAKCLAQEHNTDDPVRAHTGTFRNPESKFQSHTQKNKKQKKQKTKKNKKKTSKQKNNKTSVFGIQQTLFLYRKIFSNGLFQGCLSSPCKNLARCLQSCSGDTSFKCDCLHDKTYGDRREFWTGLLSW